MVPGSAFRELGTLSFPCAVAEVKGSGELWRFPRLCQARFLNNIVNIVEQDHWRRSGRDRFGISVQETCGAAFIADLFQIAA